MDKALGNSKENINIEIKKVSKRKIRPNTDKPIIYNKKRIEEIKENYLDENKASPAVIIMNLDQSKNKLNRPLTLVNKYSKKIESKHKNPSIHNINNKNNFRKKFITKIDFSEMVIDKYELPKKNNNKFVKMTFSKKKEEEKSSVEDVSVTKEIISRNYIVRIILLYFLLLLRISQSSISKE